MLFEKSRQWLRDSGTDPDTMDIPAANDVHAFVAWVRTMPQEEQVQFDLVKKDWIAGFHPSIEAGARELRHAMIHRGLLSKNEI
jgi:hypothetical protein